MRKNVPNEPKIKAILNLLNSLDGGLLKALQEQGVPILVATAVPIVPDEDDDDYNADDSDEDDYDDEMEDDEGCCPDYDPSGDGRDRCIYSCPECGICLREYIEEEFE